MPVTGNKKQLKIKMTFIVTAILLLGVTLSYAYVAYEASAREQAMMPQPALNKIMRDVRVFHKKMGRFPNDLDELQNEVWKLPQPPAFGDQKHSFTMHNYYYLLSTVNPHVMSVWGAPINEKYKEGSTFFLVVMPDDEMIWKGPALEPNDFVSLPANPTEFQLSTMGLTKQPSQKRSPNQSPSPTPAHRLSLGLINE